MKEYEFWLLNFYRRRGLETFSWRLSLFEFQNHFSGASWTLLAFGVCEYDGFYVEVAS